MKIAVISDIHSNLDAFNAVIADLPTVDITLCLGDIVGYGPQPNEVVEMVRELRPAVVLSGNHDYAISTGEIEGFSSHAAVAAKWTRKQLRQENLRYLSALSHSSHLVLGGVRTSLFHASPRDPLGEYIYPWIPQSEADALLEQSDGKLLLLGHTHMPMVYSSMKGILANPGSVGQPRDAIPKASYAIVTVSDSRVLVDIRRVTYNIGSAAEKIINAGLPRFLADRLYVGE
ncbi:MAG: metallophosphoesterase family protein [Candidatus Bathyarchaeia archaeon]